MSRPADDDAQDANRPGPERASLVQSGPPPLFDSTALFGRQTEIGIAHAGEVYRLRITRQGKLVLNK